MQFLISEVHPFDDGNGRLSRIMMNAELVKSSLFATKSVSQFTSKINPVFPSSKILVKTIPSFADLSALS